jgi:SAM-dependent methyltransferase
MPSRFAPAAPKRKPELRYEVVPRRRAWQLLARVVRYRDIELHYGCDRSRLPAELRRVFVELDADESTRAFIDGAIARPEAWTKTALRDLAMKLVSIYDANGLLGAYSMRVLGTAQWKRVLGEGGGRLLDVGAGDGNVTKEIAPLFDVVVTTELSGPMARRLRASGFVCHEKDIAFETIDDPPFDVVALQNVIDRTTHPLTLLERVPSLLAEGGRVVLSVPMPLRPAVYVGPAALDPEELLPVGTRDFESGVTALHSRVLRPRGYRVTALSRAPYLCRGDARSPVLVLDDAIFVLARD